MSEMNWQWKGSIIKTQLGSHGGSKKDQRQLASIGGANCLPFMSPPGSTYPMPLFALEVFDDTPEDVAGFEDTPKELLADVARWAKACQDQHGVDAVCLRLTSTNPEGLNSTPESAASTVMKVLEVIDLPLIVYGSGSMEKDLEVLTEVARAAKGERLYLGHVQEESYAEIADAAKENGHGIIAFSNLDINLAKQMNILLTEHGIPLEDIIMDPLQAALGTGLEYSYSVLERIRIGALEGDRMLQTPVLCDSSVAWKAREATDDDPKFGDVRLRGIYWEAATAFSSLMAGSELFLMRHPKAMAMLKKTAQDLSKCGDSKDCNSEGINSKCGGSKDCNSEGGNSEGINSNGGNSKDGSSKDSNSGGGN